LALAPGKRGRLLFARKAIKHWLRAGDLRSGYRRLVAACVVPLPFVACRPLESLEATAASKPQKGVAMSEVPHRYPEPARQRKATRLRSRSAEAVVSSGTFRPL